VKRNAEPGKSIKGRREAEQGACAQQEKEKSIEAKQGNRSWKRQRRHGAVTDHIIDKASK
jgi:hypothetical protein